MTLFIDRRRGKSRDEAAQLAKLYILAIYGLPYLSDCILIVRALNVFGGGKMTVAADVIDAILRHDRRAPKKIGTPTSIRREVDASLRRLGIERIDFSIKCTGRRKMARRSKGIGKRCST